MPEPSLIWAVKVDDEMCTALELDRARLSAEAGHKLTRSQYLRAVLSRHVRGRPMAEAGWSEGFGAGYAAFMQRLQTTLHAAMIEHEKTPFAPASLHGGGGGGGG